MIENILIFLEKIIISYGAVGLFWAGILEEIIAPIPSSLVTMAGGFFILGGAEITISSLIIFFLHVVIPVSLGLTVGSAFIFFIFYFLGESALNHFGRYFGVSFLDISKIKDKMSKSISDDIFIFVTRAVPFFPIVLVNIFCGLVKYSPTKFFAISFLGIAVRATIMGFLGWQLGALYKDFALQFQSVEDLFTIILVLFAIIYFFRRNFKKHLKTPPVN